MKRPRNGQGNGRGNGSPPPANGDDPPDQTAVLRALLVLALAELTEMRSRVDALIALLERETPR